VKAILVDKHLNGLRILVVEDEMMLLMFIEELLTDSGGIVATGSNVDSALSLIATHSFDVGVLDLNLKGSLSYPVADALNARNIPFIFATGYGKAGICDPYRNRPVLQKPFDGDDLVRLIASLSSHELS
jgi:DNA-binding NtrC family response regulator